MANDTKKGIGIIGYGGFGEFLHKSWDEMDNAHVVAVCDSDPTRNPGGVAFYQRVADMLSDENVEIVSIATPPSSHKTLAIQALQAEKHVLVEKPLALSERDALLIKRVAETVGRVAAVNFVLRHNQIVECLRDIVAKEVLGKLRRMDLRNYAMQDTVPEGHWFWDPAVSGGILLEHGVHFFDLANWVNGSQARDAFSIGVERKPGMEDRVFAAVKYENGVVGTFWHSFSRPRELEHTVFHFAFDLGEVDMIGWIPLELRIWGWTNTKGLETIKSLPGHLDITVEPTECTTAKSSEYTYEVDHLVDAVLSLDESKLETYASNLRSIMADLIAAIDNPSHQMRVTLEDGIEAVRVAERATKFAHPDWQF
ncbi:MAG: Gfo/Idh/MocA family oxidoreductase [Armatimonadota bacterium]|nr:Gfo/Idh/MocA family oxidoreductase [Armatimonadota bacterium]